MTLTPKEMKILRRVSRPSWPRLTLYCFVGMIVCGVLSLGVAIFSCARLYHLLLAGSIPSTQPSMITMISETWLSLMVGGIALFQAIGMWGTRSYGLLIRKLGDKNDAS